MESETTPAVGPSLRDQAAAVNWFHSIELAPGVVTTGADDTRKRVDILQIPAELSGRTVLDVGAWDGFFSFEAERRGARRVVATDSLAWDGRGWGSKQGFQLARQSLRSRVEDVDIDVMDLSPERVGEFDLVLCLGVLYHLRHPLLGLERVASVTKTQLILETHVDLTWTRRPAAAFYPTSELNWDRTNWWGPNPPAVEAMLRDVGFREVRTITPASLAYRAARTVPRVPAYLRFLAKHHVRPQGAFSHGRAVFHAFK
jgi:tRNA (mo5U34)-methyltransferase